MRMTVDMQPLPFLSGNMTITDDNDTSKKWAPILEGLVELHQPSPTRIGTRTSETGVITVTAKGLDRIYCSWQPWQMAMTQVKTAVARPVASPQRKKISDHGPVRSCITVVPLRQHNDGLFPGGFVSILFLRLSLRKTLKKLSSHP